MKNLLLLVAMLSFAGCGSMVSNPCPDDLPFFGDDGLCYVNRLHAQSYATCRATGMTDAAWLEVAQSMVAGIEAGLTRMDLLQVNQEFCEDDEDCESCLDSILATLLQ